MARRPKKRQVKPIDLTLEQLNLIAFDVRDGKAPNQADLLLTLFCQCVDRDHITARNPAADRVLEYMREAIRAYLDGERETAPGKAVPVRTIDAALGLVARRGRPRADEQERMQMAAVVLRCRLKGMGHDRAVERAAFHCHIAETVVREAWRDHKMSALALVKIRHPRQWSRLWADRLADIFRDQDWWTASGKSPVFPT